MALPPNTRSVARPSRWGNPFRCAPNPRARAEAVEQYRAWVSTQPRLIEAARRELVGYNLACYCPLDGPCHRDVWLELLGEPEAHQQTADPRGHTLLEADARFGGE